MKRGHARPCALDSGGFQGQMNNAFLIVSFYSVAGECVRAVHVARH